MQEGACDLSGCYLCRHCLPEWKELIALRKETRIFRRGEALFAEGEEVQGIYFMLDGAVKVHKLWQGQKELIIRFAGPGSIVGHRGGLAGISTYPVSATALEPSSACFVPSGFLESSLKVNHDFAFQLLRFYAAELVQAEQRMSELAHMDVKGRVAGALLALLDAYGRNEDGFINVALTRQDIAAYAGSIYETVFKVFTEWISAGLIVTEGKRIRIIDERKLRNYYR